MMYMKKLIWVVALAICLILVSCTKTGDDEKITTEETTLAQKEEITAAYTETEDAEEATTEEVAQPEKSESKITLSDFQGLWEREYTFEFFGRTIHSVSMYNIDSAQNKVFFPKPDSPGIPEDSIDWKIEDGNLVLSFNDEPNRVIETLAPPNDADILIGSSTQNGSTEDVEYARVADTYTGDSRMAALLKLSEFQGKWEAKIIRDEEQKIELDDDDDYIWTINIDTSQAVESDQAKVLLSAKSTADEPMIPYENYEYMQMSSWKIEDGKFVWHTISIQRNIDRGARLVLAPPNDAGILKGTLTQVGITIDVEFAKVSDVPEIGEFKSLLYD